jgi:ATP-dependent DNA helicase RecG
MQQKIFSEIKFLPKVGPILGDYIANLVGGKRWIDLLYHEPTSYNSKKYLPLLVDIYEKDEVILKITPEEYIKPNNKTAPFKVRCYSNIGYIYIIFFKIYPNFIEKNLPIAAEMVVSGKIEKFNDIWNISHPEYILPIEKIDEIPKNQPIYPLTAKITQKLLSDKIRYILDFVPNFPEWINESLICEQKWLSWSESLRNLHKFHGDNLNPNNINRRRLAFDELLALKIAEKIYHRKNEAKKGVKNISNGNLIHKLLENLPFELTKGQKEVLDEVKNDLANENQMFRLLQGDVGSGKTIIALLASLILAENQRQTALIVPISLLAIQHFENISKLTKSLDINIALLTSKNTKKQKEKILDDLKSGKVNLIIGTQALIYDDIIFSDLGLVIIDEQHRFGVMQRAKLVEKGSNPDILAMSATPIPRSLMIALYGDMKISLLQEKPANRLPIRTQIMSKSKKEKIYNSLHNILDKNQKIYWVCPLVEDSEELELISLEERYKELEANFGSEKIAILHGKMKEKEKEKIMADFSDKDGGAKLLLATTVIEVGVDIGDATVMVIENAENFGLAQLHQLRGRVGRSDLESFCILLYDYKLSKNGRKRLEIMKNSDDGFFIAEEDLKMRGFGELVGTRQSGLPEYKIANLTFDYDLLSIAEKWAEIMMSDIAKNKDNIINLMDIFGLKDVIGNLRG